MAALLQQCQFDSPIVRELQSLGPSGLPHNFIIRTNYLRHNSDTRNFLTGCKYIFNFLLIICMSGQNKEQRTTKLLTYWLQIQSKVQGLIGKCISIGPFSLIDTKRIQFSLLHSQHNASIHYFHALNVV